MYVVVMIVWTSKWAARLLQQILFNINKAICLRLDAMENKLESVILRTKYLEDKFDQLLQQLHPDGADLSFYKPGCVLAVV